jgi:hypothetical protein
MFMDFLTVNLGNLLTIASFLIGGIWFISTMKNAIELLTVRLGTLETVSRDQRKEIQKLADVLVTLGRYEERFLRVEGMIDDLRHGRGIIS